MNSGFASLPEERSQDVASNANRALPAVMQALDDAQRAVDRALANMPDPTYPRR